MIKGPENCIIVLARNHIMRLVGLIFIITAFTACATTPPTPPWYKSYGFNSYKEVIHPSSVSVLVKALSDSDPWVRYEAADALGNIRPGAKEAVPALIKALGDSEQYVRFRAAFALGNIGPEAKEAVPTLIKALGDSYKSVREVAADALGKIGPEAKEAVLALIKALGDSDARVRYWAADALEKIGPGAKEAVLALIKALGDSDARVRYGAVKALGKIGPAAESVVPALIAVLSDPEPDMRREAILLLRQIGYTGNDFLESLEKIASKDPNDSVKKSASDVLLKIKFSVLASGKTFESKSTSTSAPPASEKNKPASYYKGLGQSWAVVIGISKYNYSGQNGLTNLIFADDDAKAFARVLRNLGWSESHIKLLVNEEAIKRNIEIALESWLTKAGQNDQIVLFWAGHGFPDPEDPEKVYFACYDTDILIPVTGYRMDKVRAALEERKVKNVILLADTCHAGKLITRGDRGISIVPQIDKMRREKRVPKGWIFMVGADTDRQAIEHTSWRNGAFTHCLINGLSGEADGFESIAPKDGIITMRELRAYLNTAMPDATQKVLGVAKRPIITTSSGDSDIWNLTLQAK